MPPFVPRKRSHTPEIHEATPNKKRASQKSSNRARPTLFEAVDSPSTKSIDAKDSHRILDKLTGDNDDDDDDDSQSEADSDDFEDVPTTKRHKTGHNEHKDDEEMDWEDAIQEQDTSQVDEPEPEIGDVTVSLRDDGSYVEPLVSAATGKKGPSKRERQVRFTTHTLHVQALMWHNTLRNSWLNDKEVQKILVDAIPPRIRAEITRWKRSMGMLSKQELEKEKAAAAASKRSKNTSKKGRPKKELKGRDWSYSAEHSEVGNIDLSHGDPLFRLLKFLAAYWRKRFTIIAPGIRKKGYMPLRRLREETKGWEKNKDDEQYGERINDIKHFRELARSCEGSRDVGAQLFVALLRGIGLDVRMVASLQPAGFGWSKNEEANAKNSKSATNKVEDGSKPASSKPAKQLPPPKLREVLTPKQSKKAPGRPVRASARGDQDEPINLDDSDSALSAPPSDIEDHDAHFEDDIAIMDVQPLSKKKPLKKYDRDLSHPVYWAEVLSPATHKYIPVDAVILSTVASTEDLLGTFEPRGSKADKGKQVICYTVAFNADGTAKDVTIRYLKRHQLPGKTKGVRMPVDKVPIYNRKGKVTKYEERDWFQELMLLYAKHESKRSKADQLEEDTDLKPFKPAKEEKTIDKESLAYYKSSAEFVLEEHLRREEALLPGSEPVKTFLAGKGDKAKDYQVYKREDVVNCKTVESWHKEGRELIAGEQPMKYVPVRAVTLQRKREIEDEERETGEKAKQGLYAESQTDWIIPPPIVDGIIPKNAFNNIDVYVPTMVPEGAVHLPMKGTAKICKRLEISYAEACTGFEFGNKRAVPVITGVVVAKENVGLVRNAWKIERAEQKRKEDVKRTAAALHWWRKMLMGMRIIDRMRAEYANTSTSVDEINPFVRKAGKAAAQPTPESDNPDTAGGFLLDEEDDQAQHHDLGGGFLVEHDEDDQQDNSLNGNEASKHTPNTPISLQSMHDPPPQIHAKTTTGAKARSRATRLNKDAQKQASERKANKPRVMVESDSASSALSEPEDDSEDVVAEAIPSRKKQKQVQAAKSAKVTPTKSPYFSSQEVVDEDEDSDDDEEEEEEEEEEDSDESDQEVVAVRGTTARTRR